MYLHQGSGNSSASQVDPPLGTDAEIDTAIHLECYLSERAKRKRYESETHQQKRRALLDDVIDAITALGLLAGIVISLVYYPELIPATLFGGGLIGSLRIRNRKTRELTEQIQAILEANVSGANSAETSTESVAASSLPGGS